MTFKQLFAADKLLHAGACCALTLIFSTIFFWADAAPVIGAMFAVFFGLGKEIYDAVHGGRFDLWDFAWDLIGALGGAFCLAVLMN